MYGFGYRILGLGGSFPSRGVPITYTATLTAATIEDKSAVFNTGFDTSTIQQSATLGSLSDTTVDGMIGSAGGGEVSITRIDFMNHNNQKFTFAVRFVEGGSASTQQTGWTSITVNSVTYNRVDASFNANRSSTGGTNYNDNFNFSWEDGRGNPFGATSGTFAVSMS